MDKIMYIKARKCLRCGRILTNQESVRKGVGCKCELMQQGKEVEEEQIEGQYNLLDYIKE